jgi:hypothetical protein
MGRPVSKRMLRAVVALWALVCGGGLAALAEHTARPTQIAGVTPSARWPQAAGFEPGPGNTLLLFAHPKCPCTRASLGELERVVADAPGAQVEIFFFRPQEEGEGWSRTDLWSQAAAIPGARVHDDPEGAMAQRFGAAVSGTALLYRDRSLRFAGGLTISRGHRGDSKGREAVLHHLKTGEGDASAPVFGCSLFGEEQ